MEVNILVRSKAADEYFEGTEMEAYKVGNAIQKVTETSTFDKKVPVLNIPNRQVPSSA